MKRPVLNDHIKEQIRDAADIVDVVSDFVKLKRSGNSYTGLCPFHNEKTPSFHVNPQLNIYKCFGCGAGGDVFNFVMEIEKVGFVEAMKSLAGRFNVPVPEIESEESDETYKVIEGIYHALRFAGVHFHQNLREADEARIARDYLAKRGFNTATIRKFGIGYSLDSFDGLLNDATAAGIREEFLIEAGLVRNSVNSNKPFDVFRGRLMFPIFNAAGKVIAFGGRTLMEDSAAKYINTAQTKVYNKSEALYGVQLAKNEIRKQNESILVEGYTDVISLWQAGIVNVVASSGTSLTVAQLQILNRYSSNLLMIYDSDNAGQTAMIRGLELALKEGMDVRMLSLPESEDPDSFVRKFGPEAFQNFKKENSVDFVTFQIQQSEADGSWDDPNKKKRIISKIIGTIATMPNEVGRETMIQHLNKYAKIGDRALLNELGIALAGLRKKSDFSGIAATDRGTAKSGISPGGTAKSRSGDEVEEPAGRAGYEKEIIRLMLSYGEGMIAYIGSNCNTDHFEDPELRLFFDDIIGRYTGGEQVSTDHYSGREHPFPQLTGEIVLDRYSVSEKGNKKRGITIRKDADPFKTARGALKTLKIHFLKRIHRQLEVQEVNESGAKRENIINRRITVRKELTRFENLNAEELFPDER
jgi:DNA primase